MKLFVLLASAIVFTCVFSPGKANAEQAKLVYSFDDYKGDGSGPAGGLLNVDGTFYGTTAYGGTYRHGTVYSLTPAGVEKAIYSFKGKTFGDGNVPESALILFNGKFYGTTAYGGTSKNCGKDGCGTVFEITPDGKQRVVYSFPGGTGGANPTGSLVELGGKFYGTTQLAPQENTPCFKYDGCGTVFEVAPDGTGKVLHLFRGGKKDGWRPEAGLVNVNGTLYGTTFFGGPKNAGTVFSITPQGTEKIVYALKGGKDARYPRCDLLFFDGKLWGTTYDGGAFGQGTVFATTLTGVESVVHSFNVKHKQGGLPYGGLIAAGGALYGTTPHVNDTFFEGALVYSLTPSGAYSVVSDFSHTPLLIQSSPRGELLAYKGFLYGINSGGSGAVFKVRLPK